MPTRIAIIGCGAIGGITAAFIAKAGEDITLVCKHQQTASLCQKHGLHLSGVCGEQTVPVHAVQSIEELTGVYDICLIATKAYDMPDCARRMLTHLHSRSLVVSMQNGICIETLSSIVGSQRAVGCVIGFGGTLLGKNQMQMTSRGDFIIGQPGKGLINQMQELQRILSLVTGTHISDHIFEELYSKMIVNACITSRGAICGLLLGQMMNRGDARRIFLAIIREAFQVSQKLGLHLPPYAGKLDYAKLVSGSSPLDQMRRHITIWVVGVKYRHLKSSSLQSLERGLKTEVDCFNGYIAQKGKEVGVPCPVNTRLVHMIHEIEQGKRSIDVHNLSDPELIQAVQA